MSADLEKVFTRHLPEVFKDYVHRPEQLSLSQSIAAVLTGRGVGVFEAGTGTGKTLSYLVPAFLEKKNSSHSAAIIISTGTKNLQDQLFGKDIPILGQLFPSGRVALLKGRSNYLCPYRLHSSISVAARNPAEMEKLMAVRAWASQTRTGDLTEVLDLEEEQQLGRLVSSTRDNCLASRCPHFDECPLYRARQRAADADIVVVNHHLLFADLSRNEDSLQSILPDACAVIVDEAHQVPDVARQFFGQRFGSGQLAELKRDIEIELIKLGSDDPYTLRLAADLQDRLDQLTVNVLASEEPDFARWHRQQPVELFHDVDDVLTELAGRLDAIASRSEGLARCCERTHRLLEAFALLTEPFDADAGVDTPGEFVHWIERGNRGFVVHLSPLSVAGEISAIAGSATTAWLFTSATLSVEGNFDHFLEQVGLMNACDACDVYASPFDYRQAVQAWLPERLPRPGDDEHTRMLVNEVRPVIEANRGRTLFLFTSHRALRLAAELMKDATVTVFAQGTMSRSRLLDCFRATPGSILLATQSFWEGIDLRGDNLTCVVIDKLPFPSPGEPLFSAQCRELDSRGGNSFTDLSLPRAVLSLRQGFGRLIREESDRGLFILGDSRLHSSGYSQFVLGSLPEMNWTRSRQEAESWIAQLGTP